MSIKSIKGDKRTSSSVSIDHLIWVEVKCVHGSQLVSHLNGTNMSSRWITQR